MNKSILAAFVIVILICNSIVSGQQTSKNETAVEKKIKALTAKMSIQEKVGLLHGNSKFYVTGVKRLGIPEWALSDGPFGVRAEMNRDNWAYAGWTNDSATCFPTGTALAATWNPELAMERGLVLGEEARFRKKDVLLGPAINIIRTPLCGRNFEYLSEDPYLVSAMTAPYINALQSKDVAASVKHYIANNQEDNRVGIDVYMSDRALHEIYLPGFRAAVRDGGALTVMAAYNKFRGEWCSENEFLDREILRKELGFKGVLMTDWNVCSVMRPTRELKSFSKVFLQPGETKNVESEIKVSDLAFYDETHKKWVVEPGDFILQLGTSSRNILHTISISVH